MAHGTGVGQETMGVIMLALVTAGSLPAGSGTPLWATVAAGLTRAPGTHTCGWRIIRTLGTGLTRLGPRQGCVPRTSAAAVLPGSSHLGFAVSTTHAVTGSVSGAGRATPGGVLSRKTVRAMLVSWLLTLPAAGLVAALAVVLTEQGAWGQDTTAALLLCAALAFWPGPAVRPSPRGTSRRRRSHPLPRPCHGPRHGHGHRDRDRLSPAPHLVT
ncbi:anion permease [Streptomyces sp. NPDC099050]|uniref:inorganic phosphate transporter n=1 Tax=Streptomyces sp. NPDC099050 TaxID=3366100 RepID=UPI00381C894C